MQNLIDYNGLMRKLDVAKQHEKQRHAEERRKRDIAAFVDFASNLVSLAGYGKGARVSLATNLLPQYQDAYNKSKERYKSVMHDYEGRIADMHLRGMYSERNSPHKKRPAKPIFTQTVVREQGGRPSIGVYGKWTENSNIKRADKGKNNKQLMNYNYVHRK